MSGTANWKLISRTGHGLFEFDKFYDLNVNGVRLVDWLKQLAAGNPPADVR